MGRPAVIAEYPHFEGHSIDEEGRGRIEVQLVQARGTEAGAGPTAQRPVVTQVDASGQFAVDRRAEVGVVFETDGRPQEEVIGQVCLYVAVESYTAAEGVDFIIGAEAREYLRTARTATAERVEDGADGALPVDDDDGVATAGHDLAGGSVIGVASFLSGIDPVVFQPVLGPEGDVQPAERIVEVAPDVDVGGILGEAESAGVKRGGAGGPQAGVQRIVDQVVEAVAAVDVREVHLPLVVYAHDTDRHARIADVGIDGG